jgi:hypothetical protein
MCAVLNSVIRESVSEGKTANSFAPEGICGSSSSSGEYGWSSSFAAGAFCEACGCGGSVPWANAVAQAIRLIAKRVTKNFDDLLIDKHAKQSFSL